MSALLTLLATLLAIVAFSAIVYHYAPRGSSDGIFHLDQFRPAAPLAGFLPVNREHERGYADLAAIFAHQEQDCAAATRRRGSNKTAGGGRARRSSGQVGGVAVQLAPTGLIGRGCAMPIRFCRWVSAL